MRAVMTFMMFSSGLRSATTPSIVARPRASIVRLLGMAMPFVFMTLVMSSNTSAKSIVPKSAEPYLSSMASMSR